MESITSLFNLDQATFSDWVSAEKRRLPGATDGFARFLALLRMVRPVQVVWISDGQEPITCGYDQTNVARIIVDMLGYGSQLMWARMGDGGTKSDEVAYISGLGGDSAASGFSVICVPDGYEVALHLPREKVYGAHVVRHSSAWRFLQVETVQVTESGGSSVDVSPELEVNDGVDGVESGSKSAGRRRKR